MPSTATEGAVRGLLIKSKNLSRSLIAGASVCASRFGSEVESSRQRLVWHSSSKPSWDFSTNNAPELGINLGDVIVEEDDIYGNGVKVARRPVCAARQTE
jgi:hypothetical protein